MVKSQECNNPTEAQAQTLQSLGRGGLSDQSHTPPPFLPWKMRRNASDDQAIPHTTRTPTCHTTGKQSPKRDSAARGKRNLRGEVTLKTCGSSQGGGGHLPARFEPHKSSSDLRHIQPLSYQGVTLRTKQRLINIFMLSQGVKADDGESESHECEVKTVMGQSCLINPNYHESLKSRNSSAFILLNEFKIHLKFVRYFY